MKNSSLRTISACLRREAGANNNHPIEIIKGDLFPTLRGNSWCYRTKGGTYISHPSAYSKVGWSNMVYHNSTLHVEVGSDYILKTFRNNKRYKNDWMISQAVKINLPIFT